MREDWANIALAKIYRDEGLADEEFPSEFDAIIKLLRQRDAAIKRKIKAVITNHRAQTFNHNASNVLSDFERGYFRACDSILEHLLNAMGRTTRKGGG